MTARRFTAALRVAYEADSSRLVRFSGLRTNSPDVHVGAALNVRKIPPRFGIAGIYQHGFCKLRISNHKKREIGHTKFYLSEFFVLRLYRKVEDLSTYQRPCKYFFSFKCVKLPHIIITIVRQP